VIFKIRLSARDAGERDFVGLLVIGKKSVLVNIPFG